MTEVNPSIFRANDIRFDLGKDLTQEFAEELGIAYGNFIGSGRTIVIGKDLRRSGHALKEKLIEGLTSAGCNVIDIGTVPTPVTYFAVNHLKTDGGVSITGSHLSAEYNGFKLTKERAISLTDKEGIYTIRDAIASGNLKKVGLKGRARSYDISNDYKNFVLSRVRAEKQMDVVVDIGNGTCGKIAKSIFDELANVEYLFPEEDETFPNHEPHVADPLIESTLKALQKKIVDNNADFGSALDTDGDRIGFVDDKGRIVRGDVAMMLFVRGFGDVRGKKFLFEVRSSRALPEYIASLGGIPQFCRVGHSYIMKAIEDEHAEFASEVSGHNFFKDSFFYDDAIFSMAKMIEMMSKEKKKMSEIVDTFPRYESTPEIRISYPDEKKFELIKRLAPIFENRGYDALTIDGLRIEFADGWGLVRASNTEPKLVLRFEAKTKGRVNEIQDEIMEELKKEAAKDGIKI